ncbi:MAG: transglycosylase SLT domain-containing protein [Thermoanaerobaculia bacterium]
MRKAPAASIGLEAYRHDRLARLLAAAGRGPEAVAAWRTAFELEESRPVRPRIARDLAAQLEKSGRGAEALGILEKASGGAPRSELEGLAFERIRLAGVLRRPASAHSAARDLLLRAPRADAAASTPAAARNAMRREERRLAPADRARRGRALILAGDAKRGVRMILAVPSSAWPASERPAMLLALARGQLASGKPRDAERTAAAIPPAAAAEFAEGRLLRNDIALARIRGPRDDALAAADPRVAELRRALLSLTAADAPRATRKAARERLVRIAEELEDFESGLEVAAALNREERGTIAGFESLWHLAWRSYRAGRFFEARRRIESLEAVYEDVWRDRRLAYWRGRCLEREGRAAEASAVFRQVASADPADIHALFARRRIRSFRKVTLAPLPDPTTATARYRRVDELLRLRMFEQAAADARALEPTRGRDLRVAEAEFALGRFLPAALAVKRAFPEIGTAEEGRVPDGWRRLHYPLPSGELLTNAATEHGLDPSVLRALVRQESVFDAGARSRAGAIGLTQLMPATAQTLVRSVLRVRYRRAFLYDPDVNVRLGAAYLRQLLDRFDRKLIFALAAYNGGPTRMARILRENPSLADDELLESHPFYETREYVRRVMLYAESYRVLYPR